MAHVSFWEREEFLQADVCIVGAGIIGLSLAAELLERHPLLRVIVLERGTLPLGASTKNAGFACFGSPTELRRTAVELGLDAMCQLVADRKYGLELLRQRLGDETISYVPCGGYELLWDHHSSVIEWLDELNKYMEPMFGGMYALLRDELIERFGFGKAVEHIVHIPAEGSIDTGRMMKALWSYVAARGGMVTTGAHVAHYEEAADSVELLVHTLFDRNLRFRANALVLCTNALAPELTACLPLTPGRAQVLITEPLDHLPWQGVFHFDEGYYYFRNVGTRILFGGGRNLDFEGETTANYEVTEQIQTELERYLRTLILPGRQVKIAMRWAGIMGFRTPPLPIIEWCSPHVLIAFGCNGMGVALGSLIAKQTAEQIESVI